MSHQFSSFIKGGMRVFVPTLSNESALLCADLKINPERASGVEFQAIQFPGIDQFDYLTLDDEARLTSYFMTPSMRRGLVESRAELRSFDYSGIVHDLTNNAPLDLAIAHLSAPDAEGWCSPGLSCDFLPLVWSRAKKRIAHINPLMPKIPSSFKVHVSELDWLTETETPLLDFNDANIGVIEQQIGAHIAPLIADGSTLQLGIGSVPMSLAKALSQHRKLKFHGGLLSSAVQTLWEKGAMDRDARITTGVILGDAQLRTFVQQLPDLWLTDVRLTHGFDVIKSIERFTAVNSALEIDLLGQVNSERSDGKLQAGPGGLPAFARGALASPNGRLIISLPSTARKGTVSRIVPILGNLSTCTLPRYMADTVVTEHGVAEIKNLSPNARAEALIQIAAPEHQQALANAWAEMREKL